MTNMSPVTSQTADGVRIARSLSCQACVSCVAATTAENGSMSLSKQAALKRGLIVPGSRNEHNGSVVQTCVAGLRVRYRSGLEMVCPVGGGAAAGTLLLIAPFQKSVKELILAQRSSSGSNSQCRPRRQR